MDRGETSQPDALKGIFSRLVHDASSLVRAELALHRAALAYRLELSRPALIALFVALFLLQGALVCLLVMLAIALSGVIGPLLAGLAVAGTAILVAGGLALAGLQRLKRATAIQIGEDE